MNFWKNWFKGVGRPDYANIIYVDSLSDVPQDTGRDIYIVGDAKKSKWVVFQCPNHCGKRLEVNLMRSKYPFWNLSIKRKNISLWPSVAVKECGAHFYLTRSKVLEAKFIEENPKDF